MLAKRLACSAAIALTLTGSLQAGGVVQDTQIDIEDLRQDTVDSQGGVLVPILFLIFALSVVGDGGGAPALGSDIRIKHDIERIGTAANGLPLYEFSYLGSNVRYQGVMAQDVLNHTPEAVSVHPFGFYQVDYGMLGLEMTRVD